MAVIWTFKYWSLFCEETGRKLMTSAFWSKFSIRHVPHTELASRAPNAMLMCEKFSPFQAEFEGAIMACQEWVGGAPSNFWGPI